MSRRNYRESQKISPKSYAIMIVFVIIIVIIGVVLYRMDMPGDNARQTGNGEVETIKVGDKAYEQNKSIEAYLFIGVDSMEKVSDIKEAGQCDMLMLLVRDVSDNSFTTVPINRNTITDVDTLDDDGNVIATTPVQLALAHSNGDGREKSCENTVRAVSRLLNNQKIDGYFAVNMGAIPTINHLAGGVTVKIEDDFSKVDKTLKKGETIKLNDGQAVHYIHDRIDVGTGLNDGRMKRQSAYVSALKPQIKNKVNEDNKFAESIYDSLSDYMVTNIKKSKFANIAMLLAKDEDTGEVTIEGKEDFDELGWEEFIPDENSVENVVTRLFYREYK